MSYYMGDFRTLRGDYYAGDPGFFSFLGKAAKSLLGFVPGGGAVSGAIDAASALARVKKVGKVAVGAIEKHPTLSAAGGAALTGLGTMGGVALHKRAVAKRMAIPGAPRKHRRMRPTNVKALRRAIRRARGFEKLARRVMHFTSPRRAHGRAVFRVRRRSTK